MPNSLQSFKSPQDIYARYLASHRGYPLWIPEPNSQLPDDYQREGLRIGDVGVVVPEEGSFDVLFNICLPPDHPLHEDYGVPNNFEPIPLRKSDIAVIPDAEDAGCVISTSSVTQTEVNPIERRSDYKFSLSSSEGALLILPQGADRHTLRSYRRFGEYAKRHAVEWYKFAENELGRIISHNSLYLITGFYKARSWSVASFQESAGSGDFPAQFKVMQVEGEDIVGAYVWNTTRALDKRVGPKRYNGNANQAVYISGFKIAVTDEALGRRRIAVTTGVPSVQARHAEFASIVETPDEQDEAADSGSTQSSSTSQYTKRVTGGVSIHHVPQVSQPFHPSDRINQYLLTKDRSATVAITHDSQWTTLIESGRLGPQDLADEHCLVEVMSEKYVVVTQDGVVCMQDPPAHQQTRCTDVSNSAFPPHAAALAPTSPNCVPSQETALQIPLPSEEDRLEDRGVSTSAMPEISTPISGVKRPAQEDFASPNEATPRAVDGSITPSRKKVKVEQEGARDARETMETNEASAFIGRQNELFGTHRSTDSELEAIFKQILAGTREEQSYANSAGVSLPVHGPGDSDNPPTPTPRHAESYASEFFDFAPFYDSTDFDMPTPDLVDSSTLTTPDIVDASTGTTDLSGEMEMPSDYPPLHIVPPEEIDREESLYNSQIDTSKWDPDLGPLLDQSWKIFPPR